MIYKVNTIARIADINRVAKQLNNIWPSSENTHGFFHDSDGYTLSLEIPGTKKEAIEVRVDPVGRILGVVVKEPYDEYRVSIPGGADVSKDPKAKLELGILTITFPEDVASQPRIIEVTVE